MFGNPLATIKAPPPDSPIERAAWEAVKAFWEQAAAPAIEAMMRNVMEDSRLKVDSMDKALRSAEVRAQTAFDEFQKTATDLRAYITTNEQRAGRLEASDEKQDGSIKDLWSKLNETAAEVQQLKRDVSVIQLVLDGVRSDIYGDVATNTPGINGTLREMKQDIMTKLTGIESQQTISTVALKQHERDLAIIKSRKGILRRFRLFIAGE